LACLCTCLCLLVSRDERALHLFPFDRVSAFVGLHLVLSVHLHVCRELSICWHFSRAVLCIFILLPMSRAEPMSACASRADCVYASVCVFIHAPVQRVERVRACACTYQQPSVYYESVCICAFWEPNIFQHVSEHIDSWECMSKETMEGETATTWKDTEMSAHYLFVFFPIEYEAICSRFLFAKQIHAVSFWHARMLRCIFQRVCPGRIHNCVYSKWEMAPCSVHS
jgi:hypothetical protein